MWSRGFQRPLCCISERRWLCNNISAISSYGGWDVYNADETTLSYQMLPAKMHALNGDTCAGGKNGKLWVTASTHQHGRQRLTLAVCHRGVSEPVVLRQLRAPALPARCQILDDL